MTRSPEDFHVFMMCSQLQQEALTPMPAGYTLRPCRRDELEVWKNMPFDSEEEIRDYGGFMDDFFEAVYRRDEALFFEKTLFACDREDRPVGTCSLWPAYGKINTVHWLKVVKVHEGMGLGRALISAILRDLSEADFPVFLHTQAGSYRAIKLYADFGFKVLLDPQVGSRKNEWQESQAYLREHMPTHYLEGLACTYAPAEFLEIVADEARIEF